MSDITDILGRQKIYEFHLRLQPGPERLQTIAAETSFFRYTKQVCVLYMHYFLIKIHYTMKTKAFFLIAVMTLFSFSGLLADPVNEPSADDNKMSKQEYKAAVEVLKEKVKTLRQAKKEADTRAEKKAIRAEINDVKKEARELQQQEVGGGIYIGGGALIIIVLLILLL
jgi:hypothetical protein